MNINASLTEKTISTQRIYQGKIINVDIQTVKLPNGREAKREVVRHQGAVGVLATTKDHKIILVKQFRKPLDKVILEIPAGKLEPNENPLDCAHRELKEETGYSAQQMQLISSFYTSPGFADEKISLFRAEQIEKGEMALDEDEFVETVELTLSEVTAYIKAGEIADAKTLVAIYHWQLEQTKESCK